MTNWTLFKENYEFIVWNKINGSEQFSRKSKFIEDLLLIDPIEIEDFGTYECLFGDKYGELKFQYKLDEHVVRTQTTEVLMSTTTAAYFTTEVNLPEYFEPQTLAPVTTKTPEDNSFIPKSTEAFMANNDHFLPKDSMFLSSSVMVKPKVVDLGSLWFETNFFPDLEQLSIKCLSSRSKLTLKIK